MSTKISSVRFSNFPLPLHTATLETLTTNSGDHYCGQTQNGLQHGLGLLIAHDGNAYAGEWSHGRRHGWGFMIRPFGLKYEGSWDNDETHGYGLQTQANDMKMLGQFSRGRKDGRGLLVQSNGLLYAGTWSQGESVSRELLFQSSLGVGDQRHEFKWTANEEDRSAGQDDRSSESLSSSGSSTPIFETSVQDGPEMTRDLSFALRFKRVQTLSSVMYIEEWEPSEVAHLLSCCGICSEVSELFASHKISGATLFQLVHSIDESLDDIGVTNAYLRRYIFLLLNVLFKVRRRCLSEKRFTATNRRLEDAFRDHTIATKGLFLERRIGEGGYGRVYKGRYEIDSPRKSTNDERVATNSLTSSSTASGYASLRGAARGATIPVAVKVFRSRTTGNRMRRYQKSAEVFGRLQRQQQALVRDFNGEVDILSTLRHPNITLFLGVVRFPLYCIVTEYVPCGSLFDLLHRHRRVLSLTQLIRLAKEITCALAYLHSNNILHCDLKSSNILLSEIGSVKICDFGLAISLKDECENFRVSSLPNEERPVMLGCVGTHQWMAPEIMRGEPFVKASDVYSFGVILWEMIARQIPYQDMCTTHILAWAGYGGLGPHQRHILNGGTAVATPALQMSETTSSICSSRVSHVRTPVPAHKSLKDLPRPVLSILLACLRPRPEERPTSKQLGTFFTVLHRSAVLEVEENLKSFFGLH